jgi:hypothetical protein
MKLAVIWWLDCYLNHWWGRHVSRRFCEYSGRLSVEHFLYWEELRRKGERPEHRCGHCTLA